MLESVSKPQLPFLRNGEKPLGGRGDSGGKAFAFSCVHETYV